MIARIQKLLSVLFKGLKEEDKESQGLCKRNLFSNFIVCKRQKKKEEKRKKQTNENNDDEDEDNDNNNATIIQKYFRGYLGRE